ncbi:hypothetical protein, partial [Sphingobacterium hotanense]|uniref:hypothetical protein n=1 Tax=Sphingobacterium hotanense TaxID=649196 RepID=UPI002574F167
KNRKTPPFFNDGVLSLRDLFRQPLFCGLLGWGWVKKRCKDGCIVLNQERKDARIGRIWLKCCFEPRKKKMQGWAGSCRYILFS